MRLKSLVLLSGSLLAFSALANDVPATLTVTGQVTSAASGCAVNAMPTLMLDTANMDSLPLQGSSSVSPANRTLPINVSGDSCDNISLRFTGAADESEGNAFKNLLQDGKAAKGIGVSLYTSGGSLIEPNTTTVNTILNHYVLQVGMVKLANSEYSPGDVQSNITIEIDRL